jgi:hypothetical protein
MPSPTALVAVICFVLSLSVPAAILFGRYAVRRQRQATLRRLRETLQRPGQPHIAAIPSLEIALKKYDVDEAGRPEGLVRENLFYFATSLIFVLVSWAGFTLLIGPAPGGEPDAVRLILVGLRASGVAAADLPTLGGYELTTAAMIAFAFLGAYAWSILYLVRRIGSLDLSPTSFLRISAQIILACALAAVLRHFVATPSAEPAWGEPLILLAAFLIGFFPNAGLDYVVRQLPQLRLKRLDPDAVDGARAMPVELVDGIDSYVSFRLGEREVTDIQNLATENPILLCAETPYPLLQVIDWIAQAQLVLEVGPRAYRRLRGMGLRTIFALERVPEDKALEQAVLKILYEAPEDRPEGLAVRLAAMQANLHVARLDQVRALALEALEAGPAPDAGRLRVRPAGPPLAA